MELELPDNEIPAGPYWPPCGPGGRPSPVYNGVRAQTEPVVPPGLSGLLAAAELPDAAALSGVLAITVSGSLAATGASDSASVSGSVALVVSGSLAAVGGPDTAAVVGSVVMAGVSGSLVATGGADTAAMVGSVAFPAVTGSLAGVGGQDTAAMSGTVAAAAATFSDNFNRADELLGASANWTLIDGTATQMGVRSNQLAALGSTESTWLSPDLGSANHYIEATLALVGANGPFLICRATNASNWVGVRNSASAYQVFKRVAGTLTQIGSGNVTPAVGDRIRLEVSGDAVTLSINGATQASATNLALGGDLTGVTRQGVIARTSARNPWIDDYKAGTL